MANNPEERRFARGCDLSKVPTAAEAPRVDIDKLLGSDTANPFLRTRRIEVGWLREETLPARLKTSEPSTIEIVLEEGR